MAVMLNTSSIPQTLTTTKKEYKIEDTYRDLQESPKQPIRLGIQAPPGEGKTFSAFTFPNVIVLNLDNKLSGYQQANPDKKINVVNFNEELVNNILKCPNGPKGSYSKNFPLNIRDAIPEWIKLFGRQLTNDQTLVIDSWSTLQNLFDRQSKLVHEMPRNKQGEEDGYKFWGWKLDYSTEITELLKELRCNSVVTVHETIDRDENDRPNGKVRPLMQGSFKDQLAGQFTDWYRQLAMSKDSKRVPDIEKQIGGPIEWDKDGRAWLWQTKTDSIFTACCSVPGLKPFVKADYKSLTYNDKNNP